MCSAIFWRMVLIGSMRVRGASGGAACGGGGGGGADGRRREALGRRCWTARSGGAAADRRRVAALCAMVRRALRRHVAFEILLGDAAAGAGALHLTQIDIILARHLAHQRRERTGGRFGSRRGWAAPVPAWDRIRACRLRRGCGRAADGGSGCWARRRLARWLAARRGCGCAAAAGCGSRWASAIAAFVDLADHGTDPDRLAFFHQNFGQACRPRATGISVSTLSVEISNSGSSRSTWSPGFFSHLVSVPSTMLSPIWGITTSVIQIVSINAASVVASAISQSKTASRSAAPALRSLPRARRASPAARMEVTGLVSPQGTMYWK